MVAFDTGAEQKIWAWLGAARHSMLGGSGGSHQTRWQRQQAHARRPVLGVLGCMAERLKGATQRHPNQFYLHEWRHTGHLGLGARDTAVKLAELMKVSLQRTHHMCVWCS